MPVISRAIPTLLRGISQSSDALKQPDHADIQDNADSNPVLGLTKRSGLQYVTSLSSSMALFFLRLTHYVKIILLILKDIYLMTWI